MAYSAATTRPTFKFHLSTSLPPFKPKPHLRTFSPTIIKPQTITSSLNNHPKFHFTSKSVDVSKEDKPTSEESPITPPSNSAAVLELPPSETDIFDKRRLEEKFAVLNTGIHECRSCGYLYNQATGDPSYAIPLGLPFEQLPEDWRCSTCGAAKSFFQSKIVEIAENHQFGLGANTSSSTTSAAADVDIKNKSREFMVDYLINSIGLSGDEAILASSKVSHLKSTKNPHLVVNILKRVGGLDQTQIKDVVFSVPKVLLHIPDETLESKIKVFQELGLTGSHLVKLIKRTGSGILRRGLDTTIIPSISYLRDVMGGCDEKVVKAMCTSQRLMSATLFEVMPLNIDLLRSYGFSQENIERILIKCPRPLIGKPELLRDLLHRIEVEWGIPRGSSEFVQAIYALSKLSSSTLENKFGVFRSFGWSDSNIFDLARTMPGTFRKSESSLRRKLNFYMKELGCTPSYLASRPLHFNFSLEKRVKPRHEVLTILKGCKLVKSNQTLYYVITMVEVKFVEKFVLPYKDEVPDLYETYTNSKKQQSEA